MRLSPYLPLKYYFSLLRFLIRQATRPVSLAPKPSMVGGLMRNYLKRPEWLYYPGVKIERPKFAVSPRVKVAEAHVQLCKRILTAYSAAIKQSPALHSASGLWTGIIKKRYWALSSALEGGDPSALAEILAGMFQEQFMYGISSGHLGVDPSYYPFVEMKMIEELLSLAESLAVVRTETPEQGELGHGFAGGLQSLVGKIEATLGIFLDFPKVGGVYGLQIGGALIMPESPEHIYVAYRINEAISRYVRHGESGKPRFVEIGAGFGGTAYWLMQLRKQAVSQYTIIDLPLMNACQAYFLASVMGAEKVRLYGEPPLPSHLMTILPACAKEEAGQKDFQVLINENSMPEMPETVVKEYLTWAKTKLTDIFYSYNQEAFSPVNGVPQTLVPKAVSDSGGFMRNSRNYSWLRRGYVEEVYSITG